MAVANQTPASVANEFATLQFIFRQLMNGMATAALVRVKACTNSGGLAPVGKVDLQLLTDLVTEDGQTFPQGAVFNAPYMRMQGGTNAVILDPEAGDIGLCVFAMRDITPIKKDPDAARNREPSPGAPPGSKRAYSFSDALYVGGMLNGVPVQFIQFSADGIVIKSPIGVTIQAPTVGITADVSITGALAVSGDVTGEGTSLHTHVHGGVQAGSGDTGPPV